MTKTTEAIQAQLIDVLHTLPLPWQEQVLNFAVSLNKKQRFQSWDATSDEEAAALKAEFEQEDILVAEAVLIDYLHQLQQEDQA
jgi:hypothetical protein